MILRRYSIDGPALIFRVFWREPDPSVETALPLATLPPIAVSWRRLGARIHRSLGRAIGASGAVTGGAPARLAKKWRRGHWPAPPFRIEIVARDGGARTCYFFTNRRRFIVLV
jgi:hypothetical protein